MKNADAFLPGQFRQRLRSIPLAWTLLACVFGIHLPAWASEPARPELTLCMNDFPQWHEFDAKGQAFGPSVEMMRALAEEAGFRLHIMEETPFVRCLRLMQLGEADLMTNLSYSEERATYMHLIAYTYNDPDALWLHIDSPMRESPEDYADQIRLVTLRGSLRTPATLKELEIYTQPITEVESWERAFDLVRVGRADAVLSPALSGYRIIEQDSALKGLFSPYVLKRPYKARQPVHIGLSKQSPHAHLKQAIETHINRMREQGRINQWFPRLGQRHRQLKDPDRYKPL